MLVQFNRFPPNRSTSIYGPLMRSCCRAGLGFCLQDDPQNFDIPTVDLLPGVMYDGDDQCRLQYHQDARQCDLGIVSKLSIDR